VAGRPFAEHQVELLYRGLEVLLKKGADVSVKDKKGLTALMYAEKYGLRNKNEIVRLLKNSGAKE
jgi:ankyrin repeat protein